MIQINRDGYYYPLCLVKKASSNASTQCFPVEFKKSIVDDFAHAINFLSEEEIDAEAKRFLYHLIKYPNSSLNDNYQKMLDIFHQHFRLLSRKYAKSSQKRKEMRYCLHYFDIDTDKYQFTKKCYSKRELCENKGDVYYYVLKERLLPTKDPKKHPKYTFVR